MVDILDAGKPPGLSLAGPQELGARGCAVLNCRAHAEDLEEEEEEEEFEDFDAEDTSGLSSEQVLAHGCAASAVHPPRAPAQVGACGATAARLTRDHTAGG